MPGRPMGLLRAVTRAFFVLVSAVLALAPAASVDAASDDAAAVHEMVVDARQREGLTGVDADATAAVLAARHSERMRAAGRIFHNDDLDAEADAAGLDWSAIGENVGVGTSVQAVHDEFMRSASHRQIILDGRYQLLGVGIARTAGDRVYVTQVFVRPEEAAAPASCDMTLRAEDGSKVAASYYGDDC